MHEILAFIDSWFRPGLVVLATSLGLFLTFKKFGNSVSVTYTVESDSLVAPRISNIVLINHKDKPVSIFSIIAVFDKEISLTLHECKPPLILKPYETIAITTEPYSSLNIKGHPYDPELFNSEVYLETADKLIKCKSRKKPDLSQSYRRVMKSIKTFNGIVHSDLYKYLLVYRVNGELKTTFIHYSGFFENDWSYTFNMIKVELGKEIEAEAIMNALSEQGLLSFFETYALYEIKPHRYELISRNENENEE
ncbi:hypothetical protein M5F00_01435 [Acinetobacter sp. ANC 4945]|uniref:hypothetical protein n=1 Tax=Acinetobacter amyesii TaxID=2942470 RepID=UPI000991B876|nr:hypothetical protein [Acinetobacter amyesii]MCL6246537.1 hypothetical protein [Acinetobacter amyesii]